MKINNKPSTPFALYLILVVLTVSVYPKSVRLLMNTNYDFNVNVASSAPVSNTASPQTDTTAP